MHLLYHRFTASRHMMTRSVDCRASRINCRTAMLLGRVAVRQPPTIINRLNTGAFASPISVVSTCIISSNLISSNSISPSNTFRIILRWYVARAEHGLTTSSEGGDRKTTGRETNWHGEEGEESSVVEEWSRDVEMRQMSTCADVYRARIVLQHVTMQIHR